MKINLSIISIFFLFYSCLDKPQKKDTVKNPALNENVTEIVIDSLNIADRKNYKIVIKRMQILDSVFVVFNLFKKDRNNWLLKQDFNIEKDGITPLDVTFSDYNNDGYNDVTFMNGQAARGANELRSLFIFDKTKEKLIHIKNSNHYPNLEYNPELNCLDAWLVYGGYTTLFLKIEKDTLRPFAGVDVYEKRKVYTIDEKGNETILREDPISEDVEFVRYLNYNPLRIRTFEH